MERKFQYQGDLAHVPLAEVLATIHRYRVPGVITLTRETRVRRIVLDEGVVAFATSNEREVSLGMYLLKAGVLNSETAREADARRSRSGLRLGQVLLQMGVLTPEKLNAAVQSQVREILWGAFDWSEGEVVFEVGAHAPVELGRMDLQIPEVILEGIRRSNDVKRLVHRLGNAATLLERCPSPLVSLFSPAERELYERADGRTPLQVLCGKGPGGVTENARILYAFFCLGMVRRLRASAAAAKKIQYKTEGGEIA